MNSDTVKALLAGLLAMVLIYAVTAALPKIAAAVDKLLGRVIPPGKNAPPNGGEENYRPNDIYSGEDNLQDRENEPLEKK